MKNRYKRLIILLIIYVSIIVSLFLPYSYGLSYGKAWFSYKSTPSFYYNYRYDTTYLGFQTFFGIFNVILVMIITVLMKSKNNSYALLILFIVYLLSIPVSLILNELSGIGGPSSPIFLFGRYALIGGTTLLFVFSLRDWYIRKEELKRDEFL